MRFTLFGIPTVVQPTFWLVSVLFAADSLRRGVYALAAVWVAVVFVSILVHELGHAFAVLRYGLRPSIELHGMGGLTSYSAVHHLSRPEQVFISFAGPLAGFLLGGMVWLGTHLYPGSVTIDREAFNTLDLVRFYTIRWLVSVNIGWGLINLMPVLPLDGGHILQHVLGPGRAKLTAGISLGAGITAAILLYSFENQFAAATGLSGRYAAMMFALLSVFGLSHFRNAESIKPVTMGNTRRREPSLAPETAKQLAEARDALAGDDYQRAATLAELVLAQNIPDGAAVEALSLLGWARLLDGEVEAARRAVARIERHGDADLALVGAILLAADELDQARQVFEVARAAGDDRKEIAGPLIQILIKAGEVARAASVALDIVDTLSEEDARRMAAIAYEHRCYSWAARLSEAVFARCGEPDDAYDAARARVQVGDRNAALRLLEKAVAAGFRDAARAWADDALSALRTSHADELEAVLPRSEEA